MKDSEHLSKYIKDAEGLSERLASMPLQPNGSFYDVGAMIAGLTVAVLHVARQLAITREESQNGKRSPFD